MAANNAARKQQGRKADSATVSDCSVPCQGDLTHQRSPPPTRAAALRRGVVLLNAAGRFEEGGESVEEETAVATPEQQNLWSGLVEQGEQGRQRVVSRFCCAGWPALQSRRRAEQPHLPRNCACRPACVAVSWLRNAPLPSPLPRSRHRGEARRSICLLCVHQAARPHSSGAGWRTGGLVGCRKRQSPNLACWSAAV